MVCGKLGLNANVMMELRVHRWGPRSVMLRTVGASSWPQQLACFLHKTPPSTYFSNLFQEHLNIVCSSALIHTSWGTLSLWIHIASLHSSLTQLNTFYIVLLSCNIFHFVLCVLYAAHPDTTNSWKTWFCKGRKLLVPLLTLSTRILKRILRVCFPQISAVFPLFSDSICSHLHLSKIGMLLISRQRNLPPAGGRVSWDRVVIVYPWESLARHIYNKWSKCLLLKAWLHFHVF